jgi:hypothetical protein
MDKKTQTSQRLLGSMAAIQAVKASWPVDRPEANVGTFSQESSN